MNITNSLKSNLVISKKILRECRGRTNNLRTKTKNKTMIPDTEDLVITKTAIKKVVTIIVVVAGLEAEAEAEEEEEAEVEAGGEAEVLAEDGEEAEGTTMTDPKNMMTVMSMAKMKIKIKKKMIMNKSNQKRKKNKKKRSISLSSHNSNHTDQAIIMLNLRELMTKTHITERKSPLKAKIITITNRSLQTP